MAYQNQPILNFYVLLDILFQEQMNAACIEESSIPSCCYGDVYPLQIYTEKNNDGSSVVESIISKIPY